jgi:hypothetical protein
MGVRLWELITVMTDGREEEGDKGHHWRAEKN